MDDIDRLVGIITERVKARLNGGGQRSEALRLLPREEMHKHACTDAPSHEACNDCGMCATRRPESVRAIQAQGACRVGAGVDVGKVDVAMAGMIDHTLLKADATAADVKKLCDEARKYCFASVCVNSTNVAKAAAYLEGSGVMVCAVVGFPLGAMTPTAKAFEAREAVRCGAHEIDMVINIGALKSRDYETVFEDICRVVKSSAPAGVKVILETSALDTEQKIIGCTLSKLAGAGFVKTSTGFGKGGATVEDIQLMRSIVGGELGVKASGGVRTVEDAIKMAQAGANRIGASASVAIVTGATGDAARAKGY